MDTLHQKLLRNAQNGRLPMHMPGHKRNVEAFPYLKFTAAVDITEIDDFDNLHDAQGILREAMENAAALWNSERSFFLVNGSTCGILAGIRALTKRGDVVLVPRNAHKSVFHAIELCGLVPVFLMPPFDNSLGIFLSLSPDAVSDALAAHPDAKLVILTSPTYEGVVSDVRMIAGIVHKHGIPLLVDEAHGAHLSLHSFFPEGAVHSGADIVIQSLHKTLPSLTQTAVCHIQGDRIDPERLAHELAVFETSSPSYPLLVSMDECVRALQSRPEILDVWAAGLKQMDRLLAECTALRIPCHGREALRAIPGVFAFDPGKIFVSGVSGGAASAFLRKWGIEPEMVTDRGVLLMSGAGDTESSLIRTAEGLLALDELCRSGSISVPDYMAAPLLSVVPRLSTMPEAALEAVWEYVPAAESAGRTAAEYVWAYPPGIPLLIPGETIPGEFAALFCQTNPPENLHGTRAGLPERIAVVTGHF